MTVPEDDLLKEVRRRLIDNPDLPAPVRQDVFYLITRLTRVENLLSGALEHQGSKASDRVEQAMLTMMQVDYNSEKELHASARKELQIVIKELDNLKLWMRNHQKFSKNEVEIMMQVKPEDLRTWIEKQ